MCIRDRIQPHLPIRLPCYDFTPFIEPAFDSSFLTVRSLASGIPNSHGVTGGVYKTRERIHRSIDVYKRQNVLRAIIAAIQTVNR